MYFVFVLVVSLFSSYCHAQCVSPDVTNPVITCPPTVESYSCDYLVPNFLSLSNYSDDCAIHHTVQSIPFGTVLSSGNHSVILSAFDSSNNVAYCTVLVHVIDTIFPSVQCPANITMEVDSQCHTTLPALASFSNITDDCGISQIMQFPLAGSVRTRGNYSVLLSACDHSHNTEMCESVVNVIDTLPPNITCPAPLILNASDTCQTSFPDVMAFAVASDNCGYVLSQDPPIGAPLGLGEFPVTLRVTDYDGNFQECVTSVIVRDNTAPVVNGCAPQRLYKKTECDGDFIEIPSFMVTGLATATDNCNLTKVVQHPLPGTKVPMGTYNITLTFVDASKNEISCGTEFKYEQSDPKSDSKMADGAVAGAAVGATAGAGIGIATLLYFGWDHVKEFFNFQLPAPEIPQPAVNFNGEVFFGKKEEEEEEEKEKKKENSPDANTSTSQADQNTPNPSPNEISELGSHPSTNDGSDAE